MLTHDSSTQRWTMVAMTKERTETQNRLQRAIVAPNADARTGTAIVAFKVVFEEFSNSVTYDTALLGDCLRFAALPFIAQCLVYETKPSLAQCKLCDEGNAQMFVGLVYDRAFAS